MKTCKCAPEVLPSAPRPAAAPRGVAKPPGKAASADYLPPSRPHPATTEEAIDAWRNEGDPN